MMTLLAQAVPADALISGKWLLDAIPVLAGAITVILGRNYFKGQGAKDAATNDVTIKKPVPTIETREKPTYVSRTDLEQHLTRMDGNINGLKKQHEDCRLYQGEQRANLHHRLDDQVKALARMEGTLEGVRQTAATLLDLALNKKPSARA